MPATMPVFKILTAVFGTLFLLASITIGVIIWKFQLYRSARPFARIGQPVQDPESNPGVCADHAPRPSFAPPPHLLNPVNHSGRMPSAPSTSSNSQNPETIVNDTLRWSGFTPDILAKGIGDEDSSQGCRTKTVEIDNEYVRVRYCGKKLSEITFKDRVYVIWDVPELSLLSDFLRTLPWFQPTMKDVCRPADFYAFLSANPKYQQWMIHITPLLKKEYERILGSLNLNLMSDPNIRKETTRHDMYVVLQNFLEGYSVSLDSRETWTGSTLHPQPEGICLNFNVQVLIPWDDLSSIWTSGIKLPGSNNIIRTSEIARI